MWPELCRGRKANRRASRRPNRARRTLPANGATMLMMSPNRGPNRQLRRKSMLGTGLFALGIIGAIASAVSGSIWLIGAAIVFLAVGVLMLQQVGKSLP